jgi:hypothetical protein
VPVTIVISKLPTKYFDTWSSIYLEYPEENFILPFLDEGLAPMHPNATTFRKILIMRIVRFRSSQSGYSSLIPVTESGDGKTSHRQPSYLSFIQNNH